MPVPVSALPSPSTSAEPLEILHEEMREGAVGNHDDVRILISFLLS